MQIADDSLSRIYYQITTRIELDSFAQFSDGKEVEICQPREITYPNIDEYGILTNETLELEKETFGHDDLEPETIIISKDNMPEKMWFLDEDDWSIKIPIDF